MILPMAVASLGVTSPALTAATSAANAESASSRSASGGRSQAIAAPRRGKAVHAQLYRGHVAGFGEVDHLARNRLGLALEHILQQHGRPVARAARAAGRIAALAFLESHDFSPGVATERAPAHPHALC